MRARSVDGSAKRIIATAISLIAVVFIISVSYAFYGREDGVVLQNQDPTLLAQNTLDPDVLDRAYTLDSDADGLADWEEVLWSTDPYNSDTNGNGVKDGDEIFSKNDLLVVAGDSEAGIDQTETPSKKDTGEKDTTTEILAKDIFSAYMYSLQKNGPSLSPQEQEVMIKESLKNITPLVQAPLYTKDEVHTVPATEESRLRYIATVQEKIFTMVNSTDNEDEAFLALSQADNDWAIATLQDTVSAYSKYIQELKSIEVPEDAIAIHANLMQGLLDYTFTIEGFTYIKTDPLRTAVSANTFLVARARLKEAIVTFSKYIEIHKNKANAKQIID